MGRLRARLATNQMDHDIQKNLVDAVRSAQKAQELCLLMGRTTEARRGRAEANKIQQAIRMLESIGLFSPRFDQDDPDLALESDKSPGWHHRRPRPASRFSANSEGGD